MPKTPNHDYNVPDEGEQDWHQPLNENFEQYDTDIEIRDTEANTGDYEPKDGAKYYATDTGQVFLGTGSSWEPVDTAGETPEFESVSTTGTAEFGEFVSVGDADRVNSTQLLGVRKQVTGNGFGGMYVDTAGSGSGKPYYGYAIDGSPRAYHHYDADTATWRLNNGGAQLQVTDDGGVELLGPDARIEFPDGSAQRHAGPIAYGSVASDATLNNGTPNIQSVTFDGDRYVIAMEDVQYSTRQYVSNIQLTTNYYPEHSARSAAAGGKLVVYIFDGDGNEVKDNFQFTVWKP